MSKSKKTMANMVDLFEIQQYDTKNSCFGLKGGRYLDLVRVICTDFQSIREMDLEYENLKMEQFYSRYPSDLKLVCVNMPERCTEQLGFISHKLENCQHEWRRSALKARKMELEWLEKNRQRKEYYMFLYADSVEQLADARGGAVARLEDARLVMTISSQEKIEVLTKMMNPEQTFFNRVQIGNRKDVERIGYDYRLLAAIQPAGGIRFHPAYIRTGSNYGAILTIYDWKSELDSHWLSPLGQSE